VTRDPSPFDARRRARWCAAFLAVAAAVALLELFIDPRSVASDGVAYLDLGDAILGGKPWALNGYFSPLYGTWIALVVRLAHPSIANEYLVVRGASAVILLVAGLAFEALLTQVIAHARALTTGAALDERRWRLFGYGLFLWSAVRNLGPAETTPDITVMAVIFAAAALVLRMTNPGAPTPRTRDAVALGLVLGVGYYAKGVIFVTGFMFLGIFAWLARRAPRAVITAGGVFVLVASPWIAALSLSKGRPTTGDVGKLNVAWYYTPVDLLHWRGEPAKFGTPAHAVRQPLQRPDVFEFATPFPVSYPPWYDASYWHEGLTNVRFDLPTMKTLVKESFLGTKPHLWVWVVLVVALVVGTRTAAPVTAALGPLGVLALPALASYAMYGIMVINPRYVAGWVVALYLFVLAAWATWRDGKHLRLVEAVMPVLLFTFAVQVGRVWLREAGESVDWAARAVRHYDDGDVRAAEALAAAGLARESRVAIIGSTGDLMYWHRLARAHVVAEATDGDSSAYWSSDAAARSRVIGYFRSLGARAVVSDKLPKGPLDPGWRRVDGTRYAYCLFAAEAQPASSALCQPAPAVDSNRAR